MICAFASGVRALRALVVYVHTCAHHSHQLSVTLMTLCSKVKNSGPSSFLSVCPRGGKITTAGKSCGRASLKVVHLERLTAGARGGGKHRCRKVLSYFRFLSLQSFLFYFKLFFCEE